MMLMVRPLGGLVGVVCQRLACVRVLVAKVRHGDRSVGSASLLKIEEPACTPGGYLLGMGASNRGILPGDRPSAAGAPNISRLLGRSPGERGQVR